MNIVETEIEELERDLYVFYDIHIHTKTRYEEDGTKYYRLNIRYIPKGKSEQRLNRFTRRSIINNDSLDEVHKQIRDYHKEIKDYLDNAIYGLINTLYFEYPEK